MTEPARGWGPDARARRGFRCVSVLALRCGCKQTLQTGRGSGTLIAILQQGATIRRRSLFAALPQEGRFPGWKALPL